MTTSFHSAFAPRTNTRTARAHHTHAGKHARTHGAHSTTDEKEKTTIQICVHIYVICTVVLAHFRGVRELHQAALRSRVHGLFSELIAYILCTHARTLTHEHMNSTLSLLRQFLGSRRDVTHRTDTADDVHTLHRVNIRLISPLVKIDMVGCVFVGWGGVRQLSQFTHSHTHTHTLSGQLFGPTTHTLTSQKSPELMELLLPTTGGYLLARIRGRQYWKCANATETTPMRSRRARARVAHEFQFAATVNGRRRRRWRRRWNTTRNASDGARCIWRASQRVRPARRFHSE